MKQVGIIGTEAIQIGEKTFLLEERKMKDVMAMENFASSNKISDTDGAIMMAIVIKDAMKRRNRRFRFWKYSSRYILKNFTASQIQNAFRVIIEDLEGGKIETKKKTAKIKD